MLKTPLTIGRLARQAGVNVETIRYYQKRGLITEPEKPAQGFRIYSTVTLEQLLFIQRGKQIGFTLNEIQSLLTLDENCHCQQAQQMAQHKLQLVNEKIVDLQRIQKILEDFVQDCKNNKPKDKCGIIQSLKNSDLS